MRRRRIVAHLLGLLIIIQVAANIDRDHSLEKSEPVEKSISVSNSIDTKIAAFRKAGAQHTIENEDYDIDAVINYAKSLIGTPHVMGGYSSSGLDCSALVKLAHAQYDVELPRSSHDQARFGTIIQPGEKLERGDLVFFHSTYKKNNLVTHTGIYLGDNKFIHTSSKRGVTISALRDNGYYEKHFLFATRLTN